MTGSTRFPFWLFPLPDQYPIDLEGQILLRGGAKIRLQKCPDRLTVRLIQPVENLAQWARNLGCELDQELPAIGQIALRVEASQLEAVMARLRRFSLRGARNRSVAIAFVSHVYCLPAQLQPILYLTDQIALQFQPQIAMQQIEALTRPLGLEVLQLIPGIPKAFVYRLTRGAIINPLKLANRLIQHPDVLLAEPNIAIAAARAVPTQTIELFDRASLQGTSPSAGTRSIVVAVVERSSGSSSAGGGIALDHPTFAGMGKIVAPLNLSSPSRSATNLPELGDEAIEVQPAPSWGTICAQVAVGEGLSFQEGTLSPGEGGQPGIAPGCSLMPITLDPLVDDSASEQILDWSIRQGAAVICGQIPDLFPLPPSLRQRAAIYRAATQGRNGKGCVVLAQAPSAWDGLPDVLPVIMLRSSAAEATGAIDLQDQQIQDQQIQSVAVGTAAGIAARMLSANPNLTAGEALEIVQAVQNQIGHSAVPQAVFPIEEVLAAVDLAVSLAVRHPSNAAPRLGGAELQRLELQDRSPHPIPDGDDRGIARSLAVQQTGIIRSLEIGLSIEHSFMGDLKIWLIPPVGEAILLQDRTLGRLTQLDATYHQGTTPHLKSLLGRAAQGIWQLRVCDCAPGHQGILKEWQLRLSVQQPHKVS